MEALPHNVAMKIVMYACSGNTFARNLFKNSEISVSHIGWHWVNQKHNIKKIRSSFLCIYGYLLTTYILSCEMSHKQVFARTAKQIKSMQCRRDGETMLHMDAIKYYKRAKTTKIFAYKTVKYTRTHTHICMPNIS